MFRFETLDRARDQIEVSEPPDAARDQPAARAMLLWQEHCTECAAPECYANCALYDPTPLGGCRRFEDGIQKHDLGARKLGEVRFRKWGKLEARGCSTPIGAGRADRLSRYLNRAEPRLDRIGAAAFKLTGDRRVANVFDRFAARVLARETEAGLPDRFVAEIYNSGPTEVALQHSIVIDQLHLPRAISIEKQPHAFRQKLVVTPGWNRFEIAGSEFAEIIGSGLPYLVQLVPDGESEGVQLVFGMLDFVWDEEPHSRTPELGASLPPAKCIVFDLDNTLWQGVLLEGEVTLRPGAVELLHALDKRGILLSIASKNAHDHAMAQLARAGLDELFLHPQIGWNRKSASLQTVAERLDIGIDTLIFVDDNAFERAEVGEALPQVEVLDETALATLLDHPRLAGSGTSEAAGRRAMYQQAAEREETAGSFDDYAAFLRDCAIHLSIRPDTPEDAARIGELVQRTNQLNFSGRKYSPDETAAILADPARMRFVVEARDRFGSYGTVAFCLAERRGDTLHIEDLMLSCRVQGKFVEQALFDWLTRNCGDPPPTSIAVNFVPTQRNTPARMVLETLGFAPQAGGTYARDIAPGALAADFITVTG